MDIRQPEIPSLEPVRQSLMVNPQLVQQRRIEIMHTHRIPHDVIAELVGLPVNQTANAAALTRIALRDGICSGSGNRVENVALGTNGRGGALHLIGARGTMSSCEFVRNQCATTSSGSASGGAVYQRGRGDPVNNGTDSFWFRRCLFRENEAGKHGGATRNSGGRMFLYWCAFVRNTAGEAGGAHASSTGSASAIRETDLNHCTIFENYSRFAGALQVPPFTTTRLLNSLLHGNESRESTPEANRIVTASANTNDPVGTVVVSGTNHQAGAFAAGITPAADSYSAVPRMAWDGIHLASPTATNGQSLLGRTVVAHSLATNPIGMGATPPTDWDNELLTANASSSTVAPSESGCDDWRDSDSDQLPDWYETHIAALSARDGLNSVNELTPSLVLWGSRWNLLQMLQLGADPGLPDASQADTDGDGLTDPRERQLLTQLYHWDSDGDGMADGWEDRYNLDPRSATGSNGPAADIDGDGLSNLDESRHGTNPNSADTDSDGRSDAEETQNGSDPDTFDQPVPPGLMRLVRFRFGDPSGSLSEKYRLAVSGFDGRQFSSVNAGFNIVDGIDWQFRSGIVYTVSLHYLATKMSDGLMRPQPDYDCEVSIETDSTVSGLFQTNVAMGPGVNWRTAPNPSGEYFPITLRRNPANGFASLPPSTWIADNESHVLGQHWKPDFHNSKFEIQGKSAILLPVEFRTETIATQPTNRDRKKIGIGEEVKVALSSPTDATVTWSVKSGEGTLTRPVNIGPREIQFNAGGKEETVKIEAKLTNYQNAAVFLSFDVITPKSVLFEKVPTPEGYPVGNGITIEPNPVGIKMLFYADWYFGPDDVCFYNIVAGETGAPAVRTGCFFDDPSTNQPHLAWVGNAGQSLTKIVVVGKGTKGPTPDSIGFGRYQPPLIDKPGRCEWNLEWKYRLKGETGPGTPFAPITQWMEIIPGQGLNGFTGKGGKGNVTVP